MELDDRLALDAAELSVSTKLSQADSIVLAVARARDAVFWTQDADFEGLEDVRWQRKP